jgi:nitrous oxidase accessory protein NosD
MKRTIMAYMVATIVSFAVIGGLTMQPLSSMAQEEEVQQTQGQQDQQSGSTGPVTTAACGQVVSGVVELTSNLQCTGDGLIVGKDNTIIRLNGHTITGPGPDSSKVGISLGSASNVRIEGPGTIEQFQAGILASGADKAFITQVIFTDNQIALFSTGTDGLQAMQNIITHNQIGFAAHSSKALNLRENLITGNQLAGITLVNTGKSIISTNNVGESQNGIFIDAQSSDNTIADNNVLKDTVDLNNANGLATNVNSNAFTNNNCETSNPSGLCIGR